MVYIDDTYRFQVPVCNSFRLYFRCDVVIISGRFVFALVLDMTDDPLDAMKARWSYIQGYLFPWMREDNDPITEALGRLITTLDVIGLEAFVPDPPRGPGRPPEDRRALARAFVAKAVLGIPTTSALIERLGADKSLRRILGWERRSQVPSEATFSRAFAEFARGELPDKVHAALIERALGGRIIGAIARDATEIEAREKPVQNKPNGGKDDPPPPENPPPPRKRGRPRKDDERPKPEPTRIERQVTQTLGQMLVDLPTACDVGCKKNSKGYKETWTGYKLHIDVASGQIPVSCVLTSASVHDSQVAIPLMTMTSARVCYLYDLMDFGLRRRPNPRPEPGARPRAHRRLQLPRRSGSQGRMEPRGRAHEAHPHARLRRRDLRFPHHGRTRQRSVERRVRRQVSPRPGRAQGQMPSDVRHRRPRRRSNHPRRRPQGRLRLTKPRHPLGAGKITSFRPFCKRLKYARSSWTATKRAPSRRP